MPKAKKGPTSMNRASETLISSRQTVFPYDGRRRPWLAQFYSSMFVEDIEHRVMPYRPRDSGLNASIAAGTNWEEFVAQGISPEHYQHNLTEALCEFVRSIAREIAADGLACRELVFERDAGGIVRTFSFDYVNYDSIVRVGRSHYQVLSAKRAREADLHRVTRLDQGSIVTFRAPKRRGPQPHQTMPRLGGLPAVGNLMFEGNGLSADFEFSVQARTQEAAVARMTRSIGWDGRWSFDKYTTEWYRTLRRVRLADYLYALRSAVLAQLNDALANVGGQVNADLTIVVEGLPTEQLISACYADLESGTATLSAIHERLSWV